MMQELRYALRGSRGRQRGRGRRLWDGDRQLTIALVVSLRPALRVARLDVARTLRDL